MKKRAYAVPFAFLILSLAAAVFLTGWASPFIFYTHECIDYEAQITKQAEKIKDDVFTDNMAKQLKKADRLYAIAENESNLNLMIGLYNPSSFYVLHHYKMPEGYFEKCVKYSKMDVEIIEQTQNSNWQNGPYEISRISGIININDTEKAIFLARLNYSLALYLNGQTQQAQTELDNCISIYKASKSDNPPLTFSFFSQYFEILFATAVEREDNTDWIIQKELEITEFEKSVARIRVEYLQLDNLFLNRSFEQLKADNYEYDLGVSIS